MLRITRNRNNLGFATGNNVGAKHAKGEYITVQSGSEIQGAPIDVTRLDVDYAKATGEYEHFNLVLDDLTEEIVEGFGTGLKYIHLSREETKQGFKKVEKSITTMHTDLKESITAMHTDLKESITFMHTDLKGSIDSMHKDMNKHFEEMAKRYDAISSELIRTREELTRAVDNMSRLIDEFIRRRKNQS